MITPEQSVRYRWPGCGGPLLREGLVLVVVAAGGRELMSVVGSRWLVPGLFLIVLAVFGLVQILRGVWRSVRHPGTHRPYLHDQRREERRDAAVLAAISSTGTVCGVGAGRPAAGGVLPSSSDRACGVSDEH